MEVQIIGTVKKRNPAEEISSTFSKQLIVVTVDEDTNYPQDIPVEFTNNNISKLDSTQLGDKVEIKSNFRGSEYEGRHFLTLVGWYYRKL